jgi:exodeoxyribonuclease V alpha subunit
MRCGWSVVIRPTSGGMDRRVHDTQAGKWDDGLPGLVVGAGSGAGADHLRHEETGSTVARVAVRRFSDLVTVVGPLLGAQPGESLRLQGRWTNHLQYGRQFQVDRYTTVLPATIQGIGRYLGSGLIKGIGPKLAERIVDRFGIETLQVIEEQAGRLVEVPGLGPKRTAMIAAAWQEQKAIK